MSSLRCLELILLFPLCQQELIHHPSFSADGVLLALCMFVEKLQQKMVVCASSRYQKINSTKLKCRNLSRIAIPHKSHVENNFHTKIGVEFYFVWNSGVESSEKFNTKPRFVEN